MSYRLLPVLLALAITMLAGCKEPIGLPSNDVHAATVAVESCYVASDDTSLTGHVDWYEGPSKIWDFYSRTYGTITRGYYQMSGRAYPRQNGFCHFYVPDFEPSTGMVLACTLYIYQSAHNGSADLIVKWLPDIRTWSGGGGLDDDSLYWLIWNGTDTVAVDTYHASDNTWYKVPLTPAGCMAVLACREGGLVTGWVYPGSTHGTYADVSGCGAYAPYIKVWYEE